MVKCGESLLILYLLWVLEDLKCCCLFIISSSISISISILPFKNFYLGFKHKFNTLKLPLV